MAIANPEETAPANNITPIIRIGKPAQFTASTGPVQGVVVAATGVVHGPRRTTLYAIVDTNGGFHYATQECVSPVTKKPQNRTTVPKPAPLAKKPKPPIGKPTTIIEHNSDEAQRIRDVIKSYDLVAIIQRCAKRVNIYHYVYAREPHMDAQKLMIGRLDNLQRMSENEIRAKIVERFPNAQEVSDVSKE